MILKTKNNLQIIKNATKMFLKKQGIMVLRSDSLASFFLLFLLKWAPYSVCVCVRVHTCMCECVCVTTKNIPGG